MGDKKGTLRKKEAMMADKERDKNIRERWKRDLKAQIELESIKYKMES